MTPVRDYLVALDVTTTLHVRVRATSEDAALEVAEALYGKGDSAFTETGSVIQSLTVLECSSVEGTVGDIARDVLGIATLETRGSDAHDIHEVSVGRLKSALMRALEAGQRAAKAGAP